MIKHYLSFALIRGLTLPSLWMPYSWIHALGRGLGNLSYFLLPKFRKRALSNLALALPELSEKERAHIAKEAMQNLMITCLEYPKLSWEKDIHRVARCENPEAAAEILKSGKGVIFFCGHQSNWEILFLEGTKRMPGVAIGRPIKNQTLYNWVLSIREKYGGKIAPRKNAIRAGLQALKSGAFLGIVADQGMPDSGFHSPFFGKRAWSSPMPAMLSYRTGAPLIVAMTRREKGGYCIRYSDPIWPDLNEPVEKETARLTTSALAILEESIRSSPGEWLWQHNRWKQQTLDRVRRPFRHESILVILPQENALFEALEAHLSTLREIYPLEFITLCVPRKFEGRAALVDAEIIHYTESQELYLRDFRYKLIFNFSSETGLKKHFLKLAAFQVVSLQDLVPAQDLSESLRKTLTHAL